MEQNKFAGDDIDKVIMNGVTFRGASKGPKHEESGKVKTKAKKKADIRRARANRHK